MINTFKASKKIVIKIGSSLLTNIDGTVNKLVLSNVVMDIVWLIKKKKDLVIVYFGAIQLGGKKLD